MIFQTMRNALIWATEDLGPIGNRFQQQTVDQEHHGKWYIISCNIKTIVWSQNLAFDSFITLQLKVLLLVMQ